ncbi:hypothetical protein PIB30_035529 [Stylosanthes scabra]|uniref:Uncharacterized protein n=1 Tax=Stylosanthes scabra TaxID=79078 RepID=A0ABU6QDG8_9FABA|nr:hypothetical protein [Stylosanthes scabra]
MKSLILLQRTRIEAMLDLLSQLHSLRIPFMTSGTEISSRNTVDTPIGICGAKEDQIFPLELIKKFKETWGNG